MYAIRSYYVGLGGRALGVEPELGAGVAQVEPGVVIIAPARRRGREQPARPIVVAAPEHQYAQVVGRLGVAGLQLEGAQVRPLGLGFPARLEQA